jgi:hypothetical protein
MTGTEAMSAAARHRPDLEVLVDLGHAQAMAFIQLDCRFHIFWL